VQVSFDTESLVRLRGERLVSLSGTDLSPVADAIDQFPNAKLERVFDEEPEASVDATRARVGRKGHSRVPDLNRHYRIVVASETQQNGCSGRFGGDAPRPSTRFRREGRESAARSSARELRNS
jgi:hypothetical protein